MARWTTEPRQGHRALLRNGELTVDTLSVHPNGGMVYYTADGRLWYTDGVSMGRTREDFDIIGLVR